MTFASEFIYSVYQLNHAAAIAPVNGGTLVAFYSGFAECHKTQTVYVLYNNKGQINGPMPLEPLTGNPVLFAKGSGASIIYTKFEEFPTNRVEWWQFCSLWQRDIEFHNGLLRLGEPRQIIVDEGSISNKPPLGLGYIPRCNPIDIKLGKDEELLLPLYREHYPEYYGVVMASKDGGDSWELRGTIGKETCRKSPVIQPTFWKDSQGKLHAYMRNFSGFRGHHRWAKWATSEDNGHTWTDPIDTKILNANNSLVACELPSKSCLVWNDDPTGRKNLSIGTIDGKPLHRIDSYGAYPACCLASNSQRNFLELHIVYSYRAPTENGSKLVHPGQHMVIKHKAFKARNLVEILQKLGGNNAEKRSTRLSKQKRPT